MIFGDGGRGEIDSGSGVMGNGEINGVKTFLLGEGGIGDMGGDIDIPGLWVFRRISRILSALEKVTCFFALLGRLDCLLCKLLGYR